jgi:hypothetical protein
MNFDKDVFFNYLNEKDYVSCMDMLRQEIVHALILRVKEKDPSFEYSTLGILKIYCFKYLNQPEQQIACNLYDLDNEEISSSSTLSKMMELYKHLVDINI